MSRPVLSDICPLLYKTVENLGSTSTALFVNGTTSTGVLDIEFRLQLYLTAGSAVVSTKIKLSFDVFCPSFSLAESPPRDVQITVYK